MSDMAVPTFDPNGSRYAGSTYAGRLQHFREMTDPRSLFTSKAELDGALDLLARHKRGEAGLGDHELWEAKRIKDAIIHPATGTEMFLPGRMSAFVPANTFSTALMVLARSPAMVVLGQWSNQTVNSVCNYVNRAGAEIDTTLLAKAYFSACAVGCGIGLGMNRLVGLSPVLGRLGPLVPYAAVVSAGAANLAVTRMPEMEQGVSISGPSADPFSQRSMPTSRPPRCSPSACSEGRREKKRSALGPSGEVLGLSKSAAVEGRDDCSDLVSRVMFFSLRMPPPPPPPPKKKKKKIFPPQAGPP